MKRRKKTIEMARRVRHLRETEDMTFAEIGEKLGIAENYANKLYVHVAKSDTEQTLMKAMDEELNKMETVTVTFYNPEDTASIFNQLTITTTIKSGLKGDARAIAIQAAIQKNELLKWMEI
jgi:transcriptional regulator with XRE-family HTH domain